MRFEIDSEIVIPSAQTPLELEHPKGRYKAFLDNGPTPNDNDRQLIIANLIFESSDADTAEQDGRESMNDLLDVLALITGSAMKIKRRVCLFDWSIGIKEHHGRVYHKVPEPDLQDPLLDREMIPSVSKYLTQEKSENLRRALHWFSAGVAANTADDQFQYFWHSVETLSQHHKPSEPIADVCAVCKTELYCANCKGPSKHRPYDSQAIRSLFLKFMPEAPDAYDEVSKVRHMLLHGEKVRDYTNNVGQDLVDLMDVCAEVAWRALMVSLAPDGQNGVAVMKPNTYRHHELSTRLLMAFPTPDGREPTFADIPVPTVEVRIGRRGTADGEPDQVGPWK